MTHPRARTYIPRPIPFQAVQWHRGIEVEGLTSDGMGGAWLTVFNEQLHVHAGDYILFNRHSGQPESVRSAQEFLRQNTEQEAAAVVEPGLQSGG
jgi:hypothetical protein